MEDYANSEIPLTEVGPITRLRHTIMAKRSQML